MEVIMSILKRNELFPGLRLFDDFFTRDLLSWNQNNNSSTNTTIPLVNITETNENFEVEVAAPGMNKNDFKVELDGNVLTITSEKNDENDVSEGNRYTRCEFSYQSFQRSFRLPKEVVDADKIEARYENGVLRLVVPKKEEAKPKPPKMIQIN
jgi:HSP20 family protein